MQNDLLYPDPHFVLIHLFLKHSLCFSLDLLTPDGEHLGHAPVADDLAHHRLVDVTEGTLHIPDFEQELIRVLDAILGDPLHHGDVQVSRQHELLVVQRGA